ncbi:MAG: hypothetical protein ACI4E1_08490 [Lachnospira sp.]
MKKMFRTYLIIWAIMLALFNVVAFISASVISSDGFTVSFWIGYIFVTVAYVGQLLCAKAALKADNANKRFLNIPLIAISYTGLILMVAVGLICMLIPIIPYWVCILLLVLILGFIAICILQAKAASDIVSGIDEKVKTKTLFIKSLTGDANTLMSAAKSEVIRAECNRVYEAIRYSDPLSADALSGIESMIFLKFNEFSEAVKSCNTENSKIIADELLVLIEDRNNKCKLMK